jgi:RNA polymerase sigma-70 factor (ECF subfamily)
LNVPPQHEADLLAARHGDRQAFGRLIEARWNALVRLSRSIVGDVDAEDIAQDACVTCWRKLRQLADPRSFDSWLTRSLFRLAVRRARWLRVRRALVERNSFPATRPVDTAGRNDAAIFVSQLLSRLSARQRAVLHLTAVEGMTDAEIAAALGIRAASVRAHRRRARATIQALARNSTSDVQGRELSGVRP